MKDPKIKFHENPHSGRRIDTSGQTDVKNVTAAFLYVLS